MEITMDLYSAFDKWVEFVPRGSNGREGIVTLPRSIWESAGLPTSFQFGRASITA